MMCPYAETDVGSRCPHHHCWMWRRDVEGACTAVHVGSTEILPVDAQRLLATSMTETNARIAHGRELLRSWIAVVRSASAGHDGCAMCGRAGCPHDETCAEHELVVNRFARAVPLREACPEATSADVRAAIDATRAQRLGSALRALFGRQSSRHRTGAHPDVPTSGIASTSSNGEPR